jgi:hypothetical protein
MLNFILGFVTASVLWFFFGAKMRAISNRVWEFLKRIWDRMTAKKEV